MVRRASLIDPLLREAYHPRVFGDMLGRNLSHYRIVKQIGAGGMGVVFLAHDEQLERDVAIKILPPGTLADDAARKRFRQEASRWPSSTTPTSRPSITSIPKVRPTFWSRNTSRENRWTRSWPPRPLQSQEVVRLGLQFAQGLAAAHAQGIIHRDLKPANLRLTTDGRLKILDFGLAQFAHPEGDLALTVSLTSSQRITGPAIRGLTPQLLGRHVGQGSAGVPPAVARASCPRRPQVRF